MNTCWPSPARHTAALDKNFEVMSARDLVKQCWNSVDVTAAIPNVRIAPGALLLLVGHAGSGKSTLGLKIATCIRHPVVVLSAEERVGQTVAERLSRLGITRSDFFVVGHATLDEFVEYCRKVKASVVVVDSVSASSLLASDLRGLLNALHLDLLIGTVQVTKTGLPRGSTELSHEADVIINIEDGSWSVEKSRFSETGAKGEVFDYVATG